VLQIRGRRQRLNTRIGKLLGKHAGKAFTELLASNTRRGTPSRRAQKFQAAGLGPAEALHFQLNAGRLTR
jgi:hypothetical protein